MKNISTNEISDREKKLDTKATISRRSVLKAGAATTGALALYGAAGGSAAALNGGIVPPAGMGGGGFVTIGDFRKPPADNRTFVINGPSVFVIDRPAGCTEDPDAPDRRYQGYEIEYQGETGLKLATLFLEPNRKVNTGVVLDYDDWFECAPEPTVIDTRTGDPLSGSFPVYRVSFEPVE